MGMSEELVVHAQMRDDLSEPVQEATRDVRQLGDAVDRVDRSGRRAAGGGLSRFERGVTALSRVARRAHGDLMTMSATVGGALTRTLERGTLALGAAAGAATFFGLKTAASYETSRVALEAMTGSAAEAERVFSFLKKLDPVAPFDLGQLMAVSTTLASSGLSGQKLLDAVQGVVDVASATPNPTESLDRISIAIGQIRSGGALLTQDLNQLVQAGVPVGQALEKAFGMTLAEFRQAQASGSLGLDPDKFLETLFGMRVGVAEKVATDTLTGLWSSVRSRVQQGLAAAAIPLLEEVKAQLPAIEEVVGELVGGLGPPLIRLGITLAKFLAPAIKVVAPVLEAIATGVGTLLTAMAPALGQLEPVMVDLATSIAELVTELVPVMPDLVDLFVALVKVLPAFVDLLTDLVPLIAPMARLATALLDFGPTRGILAGLLTVLLGYRALAGVVGYLYAFAGGLGAINAAGGAGGVPAGGAGGVPGKAAGKGGGLLKGVAALTGVGLMFEGNVEGARSGLSLGQVAAGAGGGALVGGTLGSVLPGVGTAIGAGAGAIIGGAGAALSGIFGGKKKEPKAPPLPPIPAAASTSSTTYQFGPGAIAVYDPASNLDIAAGVDRGIRTYDRDRHERGPGR